MSFSFSCRFAKATAKQEVDLAALPKPIKDYIQLAIDQYGDDVILDVYVYGHLYDGTVNNYNVSSATISVKPAV
jgi:hypothetical protein